MIDVWRIVRNSNWLRHSSVDAGDFLCRCCRLPPAASVDLSDCIFATGQFRQELQVKIRHWSIVTSSSNPSSVIGHSKWGVYWISTILISVCARYWCACVAVSNIRNTNRINKHTYLPESTKTIINRLMRALEA